MIWSLIVKFLSGNIIGKLFDAWAKSKDVDLAKFQTSAGVGGQVALAVLQAETEANKAKAALFTSGLPGLLLVITSIALFALPTGIHYWMVILDTTGLHGLPIGAWKVAAIPGPLAQVSREIILSFFIGGGAVVGAGTVAVAIARGLRR